MESFLSRNRVQKTETRQREATSTQWPPQSVRTARTPSTAHTQVPTAAEFWHTEATERGSEPERDAAFVETPLEGGRRPADAIGDDLDDGRQHEEAIRSTPRNSGEYYSVIVVNKESFSAIVLYTPLRSYITCY